MLETPEVSCATRSLKVVTIRKYDADTETESSENVSGAVNQQERLVRTDQNPQRPYAEHGHRDVSVKIWPDLHGDMQSQAEMSWPPTNLSVVTEMSVPIRCSRRRFEKGCP